MTGIRKTIWNIITSAYPLFLRKYYGMNIGKHCVIARTVHLDKNINPKGIHIGDNTWILRNAMVLAHDYCQGCDGRGKRFDTFIGNNCVVGVNSIILPGISIGNHCVVAAGAVVTKSTPPNCIVAGNPAKIIKTGITVSDKGQIVEREEKANV